MIKLTDAKTGKVTYYPEGDERITAEKFRKMTYMERLELYNSDRELGLIYKRKVRGNG